MRQRPLLPRRRRSRPRRNRRLDAALDDAAVEENESSTVAPQLQHVNVVYPCALLPWRRRSRRRPSR